METKEEREKELNRIRNQRYREKHRELLAKRRASPEYQETIKKQRQRYYSNPANAMRVRQKVSEYKKNNKAIINFNSSLRKRSLLWATPPWANKKEIIKIYAEAIDVTERRGIKMHVDHKYPITSRYLCGLNIPDNLEIIPEIDNLKKHNCLNPKEFPPELLEKIEKEYSALLDIEYEKDRVRNADISISPNFRGLSYEEKQEIKKSKRKEKNMRYKANNIDGVRERNKMASKKYREKKKILKMLETPATLYP